MRKLYLGLAIVGFLVPYYFFVAFLRLEGLNLQLLFSQLFANNISLFFAVDLIISAIVFWAFLYPESQRYQMRNWWLYILATLMLGPSFALPLFLYFREAQIEVLASGTRGSLNLITDSSRETPMSRRLLYYCRSGHRLDRISLVHWSPCVFARNGKIRTHG